MNSGKTVYSEIARTSPDRSIIKTPSPRVKYEFIKEEGPEGVH